MDHLVEIVQRKKVVNRLRERLANDERLLLEARIALDEAADSAHQGGESISSVARALGTVDTRTAKNAIKRGEQERLGKKTDRKSEVENERGFE